MPIAFDLPYQAAHSSQTEDTEYLGTQKQAIIKKFNLEMMEIWGFGYHYAFVEMLSYPMKDVSLFYIFKLYNCLYIEESVQFLATAGLRTSSNLYVDFVYFQRSWVLKMKL